MKQTGYGQQVLLLQSWKSDYHLGSNRAIEKTNNSKVQ